MEKIELEMTGFRGGKSGDRIRHVTKCRLNGDFYTNPIGYSEQYDN